jgi:hypothetical protein
MIDLNEKDKYLMLKLAGAGITIMISVVILYNYLKNNEYPELKSSDHIRNEWISSVDIDRGQCYVELQNGIKFRAWGQNLNYDDYYSLGTILSNRVLISKHRNSDTLTVTYLDKEYNYVIGQVIAKD